MMLSRKSPEPCKSGFIQITIAKACLSLLITFLNTAEELKAGRSLCWNECQGLLEN